MTCIIRYFEGDILTPSVRRWIVNLKKNGKQDGFSSFNALLFLKKKKKKAVQRLKKKICVVY